jgi:hypothetical protein
LRTLRRIFGSDKEEVIDGWRKFHGECHPLYFSPDIIGMSKSRMTMKNIARLGEKRNAYRVLVGKRERKVQLGRHKPIWEVNIKIYLREIGLGVDKSPHSVYGVMVAPY